MKRAIGVRVRQGSGVWDIYLQREIILAASAVGRQKILQLSDVCDKALLDQHSIETLHHFPAIAANLQLYFKPRRPISCCAVWVPRPGVISLA
ncbi:hypothetical protein ACFONN_05745 [Dyella humi]|uniref:GMC family oxidoreductase N-terminal domain-containing protein n=1 Tax=Dyella humi TaxID=1770547 RepID=A0ABW8IHC2_9GAMM